MGSLPRSQGSAPIDVVTVVSQRSTSSHGPARAPRSTARRAVDWTDTPARDIRSPHAHHRRRRHAQGRTSRPAGQGRRRAPSRGSASTDFTSVRIGKRFELTVEGEVGEDVLAEAREIADEILSNSVIEDVVGIEVVE